MAVASLVRAAEGYGFAALGTNTDQVRL